MVQMDHLCNITDLLSTFGCRIQIEHETPGRSMNIIVRDDEVTSEEHDLRQMTITTLNGRQADHYPVIPQISHLVISELDFPTPAGASRLL